MSADKKKKHRKWLRPVLFTLGGVLAGIAYYYLVGCNGGSCAIASHPIVTAAYVGVIGLLVSVIFSKEARD